MLATLAGWAALIAQIEGNLFAFSSSIDPWIALLKIVTTLSCLGGTVAALWDARRGWRKRGGLARSASLLLALAFAVLLWIALVLRLAGYETNY